MATTIISIICLLLVISILWKVLARRYPCPSWLGWMIEMDNPLTPIHKAKNIVRNSGIEQGMTVLDVGCGPGRVAIPAALAVGPQGQVVALDIQEGMLNQTRAKATALNLTNIKFLQAGIGEGKLTKDTFDRVLLVTVIGEIPNQESALREIYDALKPGGLLSITEMVFDPHFHRRSTVRRLATSVGFTEKGIFGGCLAYTVNFEKP